jgi:hypothetical protein
MKGYSFPFNNFDYQKLKYLIDCFGINPLIQFIASKIPIPETLEASIQPISQSCCEIMKSHFNRSISILVQNFSSIHFDDLSKIRNSHLLEIFASESLQIETEDYLFQLNNQMIEKDKNRMVLLNSVHLDYVSPNLLKEFFENLPNDEIDFELLELLKKRSFSDYSDQDKLSKRWKTKPKVLSQTEITELFQILNSHFEDENNPISQTKFLIEQIKQMKNEIDLLQKKYTQLENESNQTIQQMEIKKDYILGKKFLA